MKLAEYNFCELSVFGALSNEMAGCSSLLREVGGDVTSCAHNGELCVSDWSSISISVGGSGMRLTIIDSCVSVSVSSGTWMMSGTSGMVIAGVEVTKSHWKFCLDAILIVPNCGTLMLRAFGLKLPQKKMGLTSCLMGSLKVRLAD